jgi:hypothetical protein
MGFVQLFRAILQQLPQACGFPSSQLDSGISAVPTDVPHSQTSSPVPPCPPELAMPSLCRNATATDSEALSQLGPLTDPCADLYSNLSDLVADGDPEMQMAAVRALAMAIDGSRPVCEKRVLEQVCGLLTAPMPGVGAFTCVRVQHAAATLLAYVSRCPQARSTLIATCMPVMAQQLIDAAPEPPLAASSSSSAAVPPKPLRCPLEAKVSCELRKVLLQTIASLCASCDSSAEVRSHLGDAVPALRSSLAAACRQSNSPLDAECRLMAACVVDSLA